MAESAPLFALAVVEAAVLNSTRALPSGPLAERAKKGRPHCVRAASVRRDGEVEASSLMASWSQLARMMIFRASSCRVNGMSVVKDGSYVVKAHVVVMVDSVRMTERGEPGLA